jgi:5,5'-dehydrodivanillate O-demethylase
MLSVKENERLTRVGPGTPMGALLRRYWLPVAASVGWTFQIRVPMDDTHTWHVMYQVYPQPPRAEGEKQENVPVYEIPLKDAHGQHITDFVLGQDMMAWVTQGPIAERPLEKLGESDKGLILYRRLLREQMAIAEVGKDPLNVFRDPAKNTILHIPTEHGLVETARARRLSTGQAPYSQLMDHIEARWANAPSAAD